MKQFAKDISKLFLFYVSVALASAIAFFIIYETVRILP